MKYMFRILLLFNYFFLSHYCALPASYLFQTVRLKYIAEHKKFSWNLVTLTYLVYDKKNRIIKNYGSAANTHFLR